MFDINGPNRSWKISTSSSKKKNTRCRWRLEAVEVVETLFHRLEDIKSVQLSSSLRKPNRIGSIMRSWSLGTRQRLETSRNLRWWRPFVKSLTHSSAKRRNWGRRSRGANWRPLNSERHCFKEWTRPERSQRSFQLKARCSLTSWRWSNRTRKRLLETSRSWRRCRTKKRLRGSRQRTTSWRPQRLWRLSKRGVKGVEGGRLSGRGLPAANRGAFLFVSEAEEEEGLSTKHQSASLSLQHMDTTPITNKKCNIYECMKHRSVSC